jgi:predicted HTH domain antitoxin
MHTLTSDELTQQPQRLLDEARRGEPALVTRNGAPVLLAVPLGPGIDSQESRIELATHLFDFGQISLGLAARIAGMSQSELIDELGRRGVDTLRLAPGELERELAAFGRRP